MVVGHGIKLARGWRAGRCSWNPFSPCFVAGTLVISPEAGGGTWYAMGWLAAAGGVVGAVVAERRKRKRKPTDADADTFFADDPFDPLHDDETGEREEMLDPDHLGEDFADLHETALDELCDRLFQCVETDEEVESERCDTNVEPFASPSRPSVPTALTVAIAPKRAKSSARRSGTKSPNHQITKSTSSGFSVAGMASLAAGLLLALFCFLKSASAPVEMARRGISKGTGPFDSSKWTCPLCPSRYARKLPRSLSGLRGIAGQRMIEINHRIRRNHSFHGVAIALPSHHPKSTFRAI